MTTVAQAIFQAITGKGWAFYYRGPSKATISPAETAQRGPAGLLKQGILYRIEPQIDKPNNLGALYDFWLRHRIVPKIVLPYGQEIFFVGIELQDKELRLFPAMPSTPFASADPMYLPYDVFQEALQELQDIRGLR